MNITIFSSHGVFCPPPPILLFRVKAQKVYNCKHFERNKPGLDYHCRRKLKTIFFVLFCIFNVAGKKDIPQTFYQQSDE